MLIRNICFFSLSVGQTLVTECQPQEELPVYGKVQTKRDGSYLFFIRCFFVSQHFLQVLNKKLKKIYKKTF